MFGKVLNMFLHMTTKNSFLFIVSGDFNAIYQLWFKDDITTMKGSKIDT